MIAIMELITLSNQISDFEKRGNEFGLTEDEIAFYDSLYVNEYVCNDKSIDNL